MLVRLSVRNFLSFDGTVEFSMVASKESQHVHRVAEGSCPSRILQTAAIWGPNASGKSKFTKVFSFVQFMVVQGTRPDKAIARIPFKLRPEAADEPSVFEFDICVEFENAERIFRYRFGVTAREVTEESLTEIRPASNRVYFNRRNEVGEAPEFSLDWWDRRAVPEEDRIFAKVLAKGTRPNQLFLHEAMDRNLMFLAPIYRWFQDQLVVLEPNSEFLSLETMEAERPELRDFVSTLLNRANTGIESIEAQTVPMDSIGMPAKVRESIVNSLTDCSGLLVRLPNGQRYSIFLKDGEPVASRVITYRRDTNGNQVPFDTTEESDGTLRLFDLSPLFHELGCGSSRKIYVIDEFDRSMHTQLTLALLNSYLSTRGVHTRTQLIFTTHDLQLMAQDVFRRDETWFIKRGAYGQTEIECLSDLKDVRIDRDVRKAYLEGKLGGAPRLPLSDVFSRAAD